MPTVNDVTFEPKSQGQKDECMSCGELATIEAVLWGIPKLIYGQGTPLTSRIRCCEKDDCKKFAARLALTPFTEVSHE